MTDEMIGPNPCQDCGGEYGNHKDDCPGGGVVLHKRDKAHATEVELPRCPRHGKPILPRCGCPSCYDDSQALDTARGEVERLTAENATLTRRLADESMVERSRRINAKITAGEMPGEDDKQEAPPEAASGEGGGDRDAGIERLRADLDAVRGLIGELEAEAGLVVGCGKIEQRTLLEERQLVKAQVADRLRHVLGQPYTEAGGTG